MGVAAALIYPATLALLTSVFTVARECAMDIGIWSGVSGLAVAIGPVSGGLLLRHFAWSSVFYINVPIVIVAVAAGLALLPESRDRRAGRFDPLGALLSVVGISLLTWSIIEAPRHGLGIGGHAGRPVRRWPPARPPTPSWARCRATRPEPGRPSMTPPGRSAELWAWQSSALR
jgi:MFS family permease